MLTNSDQALDESLLDLHSSALRLLDGVLSDSTAHQLTRPTPCRLWNVGELLAHVVGQNAGLTKSAAGGGQELENWRPQVLGADPAATVAHSAELLSVALAAAGLAGQLWMPEITPAKRLPSRVVVRAHLLDTVVHAWDLARALQRPLLIPDQLLREAKRTAAMVPATGRAESGAAFGPALQPHSGADDLDSMLRHLGRSPAWTVPTHLLTTAR